jgi:regulator of sigma E protease
MALMSLLWSALGSVLAAATVVFLFGLAIFIHEFGHFLAARWLGLQVDAFAIGFGPALWKRRVNGVEYKIGCIPCGGYVALPQLDPAGMEKVQGGQPADGGGARVLPAVAAWKRIIVSVAGPIGNVVLAIILAYVIYFVPGVRTGVVNTRVGAVIEDSDAWKAGLRAGDRILSVNGRRVENWSEMEVENHMLGQSGRATFRVARDGTTLELVIPFKKEPVFGIAMLYGVLPETACVVARVMPGTPAAACGLASNDVIQTVGSVPVLGVSSFVSLIRKSGGSPVALAVRRGTQHLALQVTPLFDADAGCFRIGAEVRDGMEDVKAWMMYRDPWKQLKWDSLSVVRVLQALVIPKEKGERQAVAKSIGGPAMIFVRLYETVRGSMMDALGFLRMICVNLAILNLIPIPVLDGGHVLFALFEIVFRRKPHPKVVAVLVNACAVLLIGLMALLFYRDIAREFRLNKAKRAYERDLIELRRLQESRAPVAAATNAPPQP